MSDLATRAREVLGQGLAAFRRRARRAQAYRAVYDSPEGKFVIDDLLRKAGIFETAPDPADSRFYEGRRSVALDILAELRWSESEMVALAERTTTDTLSALGGDE